MLVLLYRQVGPGAETLQAMSLILKVFHDRGLQFSVNPSLTAQRDCSLQSSDQLCDLGAL